MTNVSKKTKKMVNAAQPKSTKLENKVKAWLAGKTPWMSVYSSSEKKYVRTKMPLYKNVKMPKQDKKNVHSLQSS